MTNEELVVLIQTGETERIMELWGRVERLVAKQARRWGAASVNSGNDASVEDFMQTGFVALLLAVVSYNGVVDGYSFITHFIKKLTTAFAETAGLRTLQRKNDPLRNAVRLEAPLGEDPDAPTAEDFIDDPRASRAFEDVETRQLYDALYAALGNLTVDERSVLRARYWWGLTQGQTGMKCGISSTAAAKIERAALRKLRNPVISQELRQLWGDN